MLNGILSQPDHPPVLLYSIEFMAYRVKERFQFSTPLKKKTKHWKSRVVGNVTYHFRDSIDIKYAEKFNTKNTFIANKFSLEPETLDFYMSDNYQDILRLRGVLYHVNENGNYRDGYGVVGNTIFSVMNHEDFSHDMVHYYSGKISRREDRNWTAEEGLAYLWGNAYYTDSQGNMITQQKLVKAFKQYLNNNPNSDVLQLFKSDKSIFQDLAPEVSTRSAIAGVIIKRVEEIHGMDGIMKLIIAGRTPSVENFLNVIQELLNITPNNFNREVLELIFN
jgi:hypothetical protein